MNLIYILLPKNETKVWSQALTPGPVELEREIWFKKDFKWDWSRFIRSRSQNLTQPILKTQTRTKFYSLKWKIIETSKIRSEKNCVSPNSVQILRYTILFYPDFESIIFPRSLVFRPFSFLLPCFEIHFSFPDPNSEIHTISINFGKVHFYLIFSVLEDKKYDTIIGGQVSLT
jgi:hypothetical protein